MVKIYSSCFTDTWMFLEKECQAQLTGGLTAPAPVLRTPTEQEVAGWFYPPVSLKAPLSPYSCCLCYRMDRGISYLQENIICANSGTSGTHHPLIWRGIPPSSWDISAGTTSPDSSKHLSSNWFLIFHMSQGRAYLLLCLVHLPLSLMYNQITMPFQSFWHSSLSP